MAHNFWLYITGPALRWRVITFVISALAAGLLGFVFVPVDAAKDLITYGGYYYILLLFGLLIYYAFKSDVFLLRPPPDRMHFWLGASAVALGTFAAIWADPFQHKILFDEYVLQATAYHMHATKEVGTMYRAYFIEGTWLPVGSFLDKRPYFFAFLVSLMHDLTGYRLANIFILNIALTPVLLGCLYWLASLVTDAIGGCIAVLAFATMPLLAQQTSGAGMELHNLTMLALTICAAIGYLRDSQPNKLCLLLVCTILLSQSRYESVSFVAPTAVVILIGWIRSKQIALPLLAIVTPLLLVPYAWHNRVLAATPFLWQLGEGQQSRFAWRYLRGNVAGAWAFFSTTNGFLASSAYLSVAGVFGLIFILFRLGKRWRISARAGNLLRRDEMAISLYAFAILGNFALLMFYYWSRLDDVIASRFALPGCFVLAICAAALGGRQKVFRIPIYRIVVAGFVGWLFVVDLPTVARRLYTDQNVGMLEIEWQHDMLKGESVPILFITNSSTIPFVLWKIPCIVMGVARTRASQLAYHLQQGTFQKVFVAQSLRATSPEGDMGIDPDDVLPPNFRLQTIALKRFGSRWSRLSLLVAIDGNQPASPSVPASPTDAAAAGRPTQN